ncbi:hypothetical protein [uncultured Umboniibacter sp.]|uniref:hypothetical protein n=1 Tax=uncultured Umboniibacter sp. TaxID=1798917 RepID=UPI00261F0C58|nr:hypothetical protein [uncultured Umboniibacter sp.]
MKPNLVLHIGTEKTGTTSIQNFLELNRANFLKRGFFIPSSLGKGNHRKLVAAIQDFDKWGDDFFDEHSISTLEKRREFSFSVISALKTELSAVDENTHTVIISSEHFQSRISRYSELTNLKALCDELFDNVSIVCYVREQATLYESTYSTIIKSGSANNFGEIDVNQMVGNSYYNYRLLLEPWANIFHKNSLNIREFSTSRFRAQDLLQDFAGVFSSEFSKELNFSVPKENESLSVLGQHLGRILNARIPRYKDGGGINPLHRQIMTYLIENFSGNGERLCVEQRDRISEAFGSSNRWVSDNFWDGREDCFEQRVEIDSGVHSESGYLALTFTMLLDILVESTTVTLEPEEINVIRDIAIEIEQDRLPLSEKLMAIAHKSRPHGTIILEKLIHYRSVLEQEK